MTSKSKTSSTRKNQVQYRVCNVSSLSELQSSARRQSLRLVTTNCKRLIVKVFTGPAANLHSARNKNWESCHTWGAAIPRKCGDVLDRIVLMNPTSILSDAGGEF